MAKVQIIDDALFERMKVKAKASDRQRTNYNFHESDNANPHRFLNVMCHGTYCTPHRHQDPPKDEAFLILEGKVAFLLFDDEGNVTETHLLTGIGEEGPSGIDVPAGFWHSLIVLSETAVCYEVKPGPYEKSNDKGFAPWAPIEGEEGCQEYLAELTKALKY